MLTLTLLLVALIACLALFAKAGSLAALVAIFAQGQGPPPFRPIGADLQIEKTNTLYETPATTGIYQLKKTCAWARGGSFACALGA